jgi:soluble lytic murein transglycosylase
VLLALLLVLAPLGTAADPGAAPAAGPGLRAGVKALDAGAFEEAESLLAAVEREHPIVADHAARLRVRALLGAGRDAEAVALAGGFAARFPDSLWIPDVALEEGDAQVAIGDEAAARRAYGVALKAAADDERRAELIAAIAASAERSGDTEQARRRYLEIWTNLPATAADAAANAGLARLAGDADPRGEPSALSKRCRALAAERRNERALEACDRALAVAGSATQRSTLKSTRARTLFRLRRYPEAVEAYAALGKGRDARFWHARSLARSGRIDESIAAFDELARTNDDLGARSRFLAATLHDDRDPELARKSFAWVAKNARARSLRTESRWRLGWHAFRTEQYAEAARIFGALAADEPDVIEALRGHYWQARSQMQQGDPAGAAAMQKMAATYPFTYYGWRASEFGADPPPPPPAPRDMRLTLDPEEVRRQRILLEAGLNEAVGRELGALRREIGTRGDLLTVAQLYQDAERFHDAEVLAISGRGIELARGPRGGSPELFWVAWPTAFAPEVDAAVRGREVPPELVYAVMREESGYRPAVRSVVGARGLTQIMPTTGERLAADLGAASFDPDELFLPARNLELGAFYLERLLATFDGRLSAAIASYNAGPSAVQRWIARDGLAPDDVFVESIPYEQTRKYVKRVLRSLHAYESLY